MSTAAHRGGRPRRPRVGARGATPALLLAVGLLALGCAGSPAAVPDERPATRLEPPLAELLLVAPAAEARPLAGRSRVRRGWLAFVPGVPYARQRIAPERVARDAHLAGFDLRVHVADALARDLQAHGVARTVARVGLAGASGDLADGSYRLDLTLDEGIWNRSITTYGLSAAGMALWILGAPSSYGEVELALTAELRDEDGRSLGRTSLRAVEPTVELLYRSPFWRALRAAYDRLVPELRRFVVAAIRAARSGDTGPRM
ncbi:MAG: hypothetical protein ACQGVK_21755 [Myxococcota bacterium]